jgi:hypothetical protein
VDPAAVTVYGARAGDFLADRFSIAAGDFNGDGFGDILAGAPLAGGPDGGRPGAGEAYVIFGSAQPQPVIDLAQEAPVRIIGEKAGDNLGFTVAAGDVNGDGTGDLLIGARFAAAGNRPSAGKVYVLYGREGLSGGFDMAAGEHDVLVTGADTGDFLSIALTAGDVNGDGTADIIMGASGGSGPAGDRPGAGEVRVLLGGPHLPPLTDLRATEPHLSVYAATAGDSLPNHLAAGDLDGDGRDEIIIGAPFAGAPAVDGMDREDAGAVWIVPVPEDGGVIDLASPPAGVVQVTGAARKDQMGFQVAAADVNGDGIEDAIIGARDADGPDDAITNGGEVHVLFGRSGLPPSLDLAREFSDVMIFGGVPIGAVGFSVAAGEVNGDGIADILTGAPIGGSCGDARPGGGSAYAVFGREQWPEAVRLQGAGDLTFLGAEEGDALGFSVAMADYNGDGLDDIVLGALLAGGPDNERPEAGEMYIIYSEAQ